MNAGAGPAGTDVPDDFDRRTNVLFSRSLVFTDVKSEVADARVRIAGGDEGGDLRAELCDELGEASPPIRSNLGGYGVSCANSPSLSEEGDRSILADGSVNRQQMGERVGPGEGAPCEGIEFQI